jgi:histone deacetylase 6
LFLVVEEFKPDVIIISCGFDGAVHDQLGWSNLTAMMYAYMTKKLIDICDRVLVVQEGGYNIDLLGQHASGVVRALTHGKQSMETFEPEPTPTDVELGISCFDDIKKEDCKEWAL